MSTIIRIYKIGNEYSADLLGEHRWGTFKHIKSHDWFPSEKAAVEHTLLHKNAYGISVADTIRKNILQEYNEGTARVERWWY